MSDDRAAPGLADLPDEVRHRIHALTAEALPDVAKLPPPLRKVADFAPARRARLGASAMTAALESDEEFRDRVGVQVAGGLPQPVADLDLAPGDDPVERGRSGLAGPPRRLGGRARRRARGSWRERPAHAGRRRGGPAPRSRWRRPSRRLRDVRARHREELAELKAENATLRRKLGEARSALREALTAADEAGAAADQLRGQAEAAAALGREGGPPAAGPGGTARGRRPGPTGGPAAPSGTRRACVPGCCSTPSSTPRPACGASSRCRPRAGAPGDRLEASLASEGTRTPTSAGSLGPTSPALLEQYLALPRARLIVDGYNVSKSAWPTSSLEAQRTRLLQRPGAGGGADRRRGDRRLRRGVVGRRGRWSPPRGA